MTKLTLVGEQKMESWAPCGSRHAVSDRGRVYAFATPGIAGRGSYIGTLRPDGYVMVYAGRRVPVLVHRLVAEAFIGACPEGHECDHINGEKDDNRVENLRWVTHGDNMRHYEELRREKG